MLQKYKCLNPLCEYVWETNLTFTLCPNVIENIPCQSKYYKWLNFSDKLVYKVKRNKNESE